MPKIAALKPAAKAYQHGAKKLLESKGLRVNRQMYPIHFAHMSGPKFGFDPTTDLIKESGILLKLLRERRGGKTIKTKDVEIYYRTQIDQLIREFRFNLGFLRQGRWYRNQGPAFSWPMDAYLPLKSRPNPLTRQLEALDWKSSKHYAAILATDCFPSQKGSKPNETSIPIGSLLSAGRTLFNSCLVPELLDAVVRINAENSLSDQMPRAVEAILSSSLRGLYITTELAEGVFSLAGSLAPVLPISLETLDRFTKIPA